MPSNAATVEEKIFYPAVMAKSTSHKLHESVGEHRADQLAAIGNETLAMFEQLMNGHPSKNIPKETNVAASLPRVS